MPTAARGTSAASAEAFVAHWITILNYSGPRGDAERISTLSSPQCAACTAIADLIESVHSAGGRIYGRGWKLLDINSSVMDDSSSMRVNAYVKVRRQVIVAKAGAKSQIFPGGRGHKIFELMNRSGSWSVTRLEQPE